MILEHKRKCPSCNGEIIHRGKWAKYSCQTSEKKGRECRKCNNRAGNKNPFFGKRHTDETKKGISNFRTGNSQSDETKQKIGVAVRNRYSNPEERERTSKQVMAAMHRPEVRKKHLEALHHSKWIKVRTDKGQLELLKRWNKLGFHFEPNYQIHTDEDLFYIDGYDKEHNVVMEYDGAYHQKPSQQKKDLIRQKKIINILNPKKFWRFDAITKQVTNVLKEGE
jgi:very-short-patch-repair endonuclease